MTQALQTQTKTTSQAGDTRQAAKTFTRSPNFIIAVTAVEECAAADDNGMCHCAPFFSCRPASARLRVRLIDFDL